MKNIFLLLLAILALSCRQRSESNDEKNMGDTIRIDSPLTDSDVHDNINYDSPDKNEFAEFGITNGPVVLKLRDWKKNINIGTFGVANDTLSRVLTLESDTHKGSTVTEYKYDDINLEFFTPKGSNESWLRAIEIKGGPWATARGIKVGDSFSDLKNMYPKLANDPKDNTLYTYVVGDSVIQFGVTADRVTRIKINYNIP